MIQQHDAIDVVNQVSVKLGVQFKGATADQIDSLSELIGRPIPAQLREWLLYCNCAALGPGGTFGTCKKRKHWDIASLLRIFPTWKQRAWLPVAGDGVGSFYVLKAESNQLQHWTYFIDEVDYGSIAYVVASDLWTFIWFYLQQDLGDDWWPFDRERVLRIDPDLQYCTDARMPWEVA